MAGLAGRCAGMAGDAAELQTEPQPQLGPAPSVQDVMAGSDPSSGLVKDLDRLLSVNINTTTTVDAVNLQKVLTFLVSSVQAIAGAALKARDASANVGAQLAAATEQLGGLRGDVGRLDERLDAAEARVSALVDDASAEERHSQEVAELRAAMADNHARLEARLADAEARLEASAGEARGELFARVEADVAGLKVDTARKLEGLSTNIEAASAQKAAELTAHIEACEAGLSARMESITAESSREVERLRDFVSDSAKAGGGVPLPPSESELSEKALIRTELSAAAAACEDLSARITSVHEEHRRADQATQQQLVSLHAMLETNVQRETNAHAVHHERHGELKSYVVQLDQQWNLAVDAMNETFDNGEPSADSSRRNGSGGGSSKPQSTPRMSETIDAMETVEERAQEERDPLPSAPPLPPSSSSSSLSPALPTSAPTVPTHGTSSAGSEAATVIAGAPSAPQSTSATPSAASLAAQPTATEETTETATGEPPSAATPAPAAPAASPAATAQPAVATATAEQLSAAESAALSPANAPAHARAPRRQPGSEPSPSSSLSSPPSSAGDLAEGFHESGGAGGGGGDDRLPAARPQSRSLRSGANSASSSSSKPGSRGSGGLSNGAARQPDSSASRAGLVRLASELKSQSSRLAQLEEAIASVASAVAANANGAPAPVAPLLPLPVPVPQPVPVNGNAGPTSEEVREAVASQVAVVEQRLSHAAGVEQATLRSEIDQVSMQLEAVKTLRAEMDKQATELADAQAADETLAGKIQLLEKRLDDDWFPSSDAPAPEPESAPSASGMTEEEKQQHEQALAALQASVSTQSEEMKTSMFQEVDGLRRQLDEISASLPRQVEAVADGLATIRKNLGDKADAQAVANLEGVIDSLGQQIAAKKLPGSNSPPMSPSQPPRRRVERAPQQPPTITARIISPDLSDVHAALNAIRMGLQHKADVDTLSVMERQLQPKMKELSRKLRQVDELATRIRRNDGSGGGSSGDDLSSRNVSELRRELNARPDLAEVRSIAERGGRGVVRAFRDELTMQERRLFDGLCCVFRENSLSLAQLMREELAALRRGKADRVDVRRLERTVREAAEGEQPPLPGTLARGLAITQGVGLHGSRGAQTANSLEGLQTRLEEQLLLLKQRYERDGWGTKPLAAPGFGKSTRPSTTHTTMQAGSQDPMSAPPNVTYSHFELPALDDTPGYGKSGKHTGLPSRPRTTSAMERHIASPRKGKRGTPTSKQLDSLPASSTGSLGSDGIGGRLSPSFRPRSRPGHLKPLSRGNFLDEGPTHARGALGQFPRS
jgi:hypothetical protein